MAFLHHVKPMKNILLLIPQLMGAINVNGNALNVILYQSESNIEYYTYYDYEESIDIYSMKTTNNTPRNELLDIHTNNYSVQWGSYTEIAFQNLYALQITPYYQISNTDIDLTEKIRLDFNINTEIEFTYNAFWTTDSTLRQYMDYNAWTTTWPSQIWGAINQGYVLTNKYILYQDETEQATTNTRPFLEIPINDLAIDQNQTIWLFMYVETNKIDRNNIQDSTIANRHLSVEQMELNATILDYGRKIEIVDITGLMFTVLTMPFTFISQAFDLTLFPNTAYQINIGNLFLGLIGVALLLWVLKIILGRVDLGGLLNDANAKRQEINRHNRAVKLEKQKNANKVSEQRMREANRHVRETHKDGKQE